MFISAQIIFTLFKKKSEKPLKREPLYTFFCIEELVYGRWHKLLQYTIFLSKQKHTFDHDAIPLFYQTMKERVNFPESPRRCVGTLFCRLIDVRCLPALNGGIN